MTEKIAEGYTHAMNIASAPPPICLPNALIAASMSLARIIPFSTDSKTLMINPAASPPRMTRVQLIFPMAASSNRTWSNSTPRVAQAKGACGRLLLCCQGLKSVFPGSLLLDSANLLFGLEPIVEIRAGLIASLNVEFIGSTPDSLFKRKRLDRRLLRACGFWHRDHLW